MSLDPTENVDVLEDSGNSAQWPTRRNLLSLGGIAAGVAALATEGRSQVHPTADPTSIELRLINRMTYGVTDEEANLIDTLGFEGYRDRYISESGIDDSALEASLKSQFPRLSKKPYQLYDFADDWYTSFQLVEATAQRMAFSKRQLHAKMCEFWRDHFNVTLSKVPGWLLVDFDKQIRTHALGKFPDLLKYVATHQAVLVFLDNTENIGATGNVNFARELMELMTIGVDGGYTPTDIRSVARCFSGWTYLWAPGSPGHGLPAFNEWGHDYTAKTVLGVKIPAGGGKTDGDKVLRILGTHPSTAHFISKKLARFFLAYDPDPAVVDAMASTYLSTGGDIKKILAVLFKKANFTDLAPKFKRPLHLMVGGLRQMKGTMVGDQWSFIYEHLGGAGHIPWTWTFPDGFPDKLSFWSGLMLPRWNFGLMLPQSYVWGLNVDIPGLLAGASSPLATLNRIDSLLFGGSLKSRDRATLRDFLAIDPSNPYRIQATFALALTLPAYQWY